LSDDLLSSFEGSGFGFVESDLHLLDLDLQSLSDSLDVHAVLLFLTELLSQTGCVGGSLEFGWSS
jgi:hypothetical protein